MQRGVSKQGESDERSEGINSLTYHYTTCDCGRITNKKMSTSMLYKDLVHLHVDLVGQRHINNFSHETRASKNSLQIGPHVIGWFRPAGLLQERSGTSDHVPGSACTIKVSLMGACCFV